MEVIGFILIVGMVIGVLIAMNIGTDRSKDVCEEAKPGEILELLREGLSEDEDTSIFEADDWLEDPSYSNIEGNHYYYE